MDTTRFDTLTRKFGRRLGRRRAIAALGAGVGLAALGALRPKPAAARPYCGNCDEICANCELGNVGACRVCGACVQGWCYDCPGPQPCDGQ